MGRYDSHKNPFATMMNAWAHRRIGESLEQMAKSIPAHVVEIAKDFVKVAFDTKNSIFTPPVMKMTQSFSRFGREPTQKKDMGLAVPGNYYLGGNTAYAGGRTNFYPRGNLSTLSFQPLANHEAPSRDYDQHWETGGPNGWRVKVQEDQQKQQQSSSSGSQGMPNAPSTSAMVARTRAHRMVMQQRNPIQFATNGNGSSNQSGQSNQQQKKEKDYTELSFNKDGRCIVQSKDRKHYLDINQKKKECNLTGEGNTNIFGKDWANIKSKTKITLDPDGSSQESGAGWDEESGKEGGGSSSGGSGGSGGGSGKVYLGGDGSKGKYAPVMTAQGPSKNTFAKVG